MLAEVLKRTSAAEAATAAAAVAGATATEQLREDMQTAHKKVLAGFCRADACVGCVGSGVQPRGAVGACSGEAWETSTGARPQAGCFGDRVVERANQRPSLSPSRRP